MNTHIRSAASALGWCLAGMLTACSMHMPIPDELASKAEEMPVKRKNSMLTDRVKWVHFGPYSVEDIHAKGKPTDRSGKFGHSKQASEARYYFSVVSGEKAPWTCDCRNHAEREDYFPLLGRAREVGYRVTLECSLIPPGGGAPWNMSLVEEDSSGGNLRGNLSDGERLIEVAGTHEYRGRKAKSLKHTGFQFLDGTGTLGAVELLGKQKVLIDENIPADVRPILATVSAALLLYQDLNQRMKEEMQNKSAYGIEVAAVEQPRK
ncbi:MAG: hypothetical protein JWO30_4614 [Fibrobacteres bacterium]|nr:hypothetical protein [Fibrobacterota bacterium]